MTLLAATAQKYRRALRNGAGARFTHEELQALAHIGTLETLQIAARLREREDAATGSAHIAARLREREDAATGTLAAPDAAMLWVSANIHVPCSEARRDFAEAHRAGQSHIAARLRERADAATGSAQAVMYEIVRMIEEGTL